jgi:conjugative relaxase-like TrwC/TraI family protein
MARLGAGGAAAVRAVAGAAAVRAAAVPRLRTGWALAGRGLGLVLSIGKLAAGQASYYERQVAQGRDDYYSGRGEAPGEWVGRGSSALGLSGRVQAAQFNALMAGRDPSDQALERGLRDSRGEPKVVGFDLTFSAPKSVSVLFATADEQTAGALVAAHETAVRAALEYVEDEAVRVRRGKAGAIVEAGEGVVAAAYRHRMSRSLDPQLHTHVVCANVARGRDGRWTALDGRQLYEHAKTAGYLYQAHLRGEVRERLGLEWGPVSKGAADLRALPAEVLSVFSRRRQEIVEAAREAGVEDLASERGKYLAVLTRERKQYGIETHTWREEVRARASEHGLDQQAIEQLVDAGQTRLANDELGDVAVDERAVGDQLAGEQGLTEKANTFMARDVLREYAAAAEQGARVADVREQGERFTGRGDVLDTVHGEHTTQDLVAAERRLIAAAIGRSGEGTAIVEAGVLERAMAAVDRPLPEEQAETVRGVTRSGNGVDVVEALAGTGKTFTAGALRQVYEDAGYHVIGIAPTGRAVRELAEEASVPAWTLDRALIDLQRGVPLPERTVVLLDEAGMASTRGTQRLLAAAQDAGAKVIAIGDSGQLPSVQAGGWMREVGQRVGVHRLTQVMRQRDLGERRALAQLHDGRSDAYLDWAGKQDRVVVHTDDSATSAALSDWKRAAGEQGAGQAVLIARDNDTRAALNAAAREHVRELGQLGEDVDYGPVTVAAGDRVICRRNDRFADVDNGTRGTVLQTRPEGLLIETDAGPVRTLPAIYVAEHVEHAYCLTGHGMQGATVEHATVVATPRALTRGWSYTALSRARATTRLHIDGQDVPAGQAAERAELAPHDSHRRPQREEVLARAAERMTIRDDEDLAITQLPLGPVPGRRPDDHELGHAPASPERTATDTEPQLRVPAQRAALRELRAELRAELRDLAAERAALPLRALRELDAVEQETEQLQGQRDNVAARLASLPRPQRTVLGRTKDPHAAQRAHLSAAIDGADRQLTALASQRDRLLTATNGLPAAREERDTLDRRENQLQREARELRDELAERDVIAPPAWAIKTFGERPSHGRAGEQWDRGVRTIARYRIDHDIPDNIPGLGPEPKDRRARGAWRQVDDTVEQIQRRLGRSIDRNRDRSSGLEL